MEDEKLKEILSIFETELANTNSSPEFLMYLQEKICKAYVVQNKINFSKEEFITLIKAEIPRFIESYQGLEYLIQRNISNPNTNFGISISFQLIDLFKIMNTCSTNEEFEQKKKDYFQELKQQPRFTNMHEYIFPNLKEITLEQIRKVYTNFVENVDCLTPEWSGKMFMIIDSREPLYKDGKINNDIFHFEYLDKIVNFAQSHNKKIRMHTLVWHSQFPKSLESATKEETLEFLDTYFQKLSERYGDSFYAIDVLNEIASDHEAVLRDSPWKDKLGDQYFVDVLKLARKYFPNSQLIYNEFGEEREYKLEKILNIIEQIKKAETEIGCTLLDGYGIQAHYSQYTTDESITRAYSALSTTGKKLQISEFDVDEHILKGEITPNKDINIPLKYQINRVFRTTFGTALGHGIELFNMWGVSRNVSWHANHINTFLDQDMEISPYLNQVISVYSQSKKRQNTNTMGDKYV